MSFSKVRQSTFLSKLYTNLLLNLHFELVVLTKTSAKNAGTNKSTGWIIQGASPEKW
jgi:hypothetical protein